MTCLLSLCINPIPELNASISDRRSDCYTTAVNGNPTYTANFYESNRQNINDSKQQDVSRSADASFFVPLFSSLPQTERIFQREAINKAESLSCNRFGC